MNAIFSTEDKQVNESVALKRSQFRGEGQTLKLTIKIRVYNRNVSWLSWKQTNELGGSRSQEWFSEDVRIES